MIVKLYQRKLKTLSFEEHFLWENQGWENHIALRDYVCWEK